MSTNSLERAIEFIKQGKPLKAQKILQTLIAADHHNLPAWFRLAETCPTNQRRLSVLEICLEYNPDNEQVKQALSELQNIPAQQLSISLSKSIRETKEELPRSCISIILIRLALFVLLMSTCALSAKVRLLAPGFALMVLGLFTVIIPLIIHLIIHIITIIRIEKAKSELFWIIFLSHSSLFLYLANAYEASDGGAGFVLPFLLKNAGIVIPGLNQDTGYVLAIISTITLVVSWIMLISSKFYKKDSYHFTG